MREILRNPFFIALGLEIVLGFAIVVLIFVRYIA